MGVPVTELCARASVGVRTYYDMRDRTYDTRPDTLKRLEMALNRFKIGHAETGPQTEHATFRSLLVLAAFMLRADAKAALAADPARRATVDPEWREASLVRWVALSMMTNQFGFRPIDAARAAGVSKQAVSQAMRNLEDRRDADEAIDKVLRTIEEIFS